ncbi:MAG: putative Ig domain-containing protein [Acidobacteria bacterium]|nr:putative Ig domain-containing protein [Acidobacteriota bacterium]
MSGALPAGLALSAANGTISGTPTGAGTSEFTVRASDAQSATATRACSIVVGAPGLRILSAATLPDGSLGDAYEQRLTADGGRGPYTWTIAGGALPDGLVLSDDGSLQGSPTATGRFQFTIQAADQDRRSASQTFTLRVLPAQSPRLLFLDLPEIVAPAQQPAVKFTLDRGYPVAIRGVVVLRFTPDPGLNVDDPAVRFMTGERSVEFDIPANSTEPVFPVPQLALQTGTVAGTIELAVLLAAEDLDVTPSPAPVRTIRVDRTAPVITSVRLVSTATGFEVQVIGFSTTREVSSATFQFTPAAGSRIEASELTIETNEAARLWFQDPVSAEFGGQFRFVQPFTVQGATVSEVGVTLTNAQGTSSAMRARF